jgi:hypothetical protein
MDSPERGGHEDKVGAMNVRWGDERRFHAGMAIALAVVVIVGFAPSFYLKPFFADRRPLSALVSVHGVAFSAWIALLLTQTALIAARRPDLHRKLGMAGAVLAVAMVFLGAATALSLAARLLPDRGAVAAGHAAVAIFDLPIFATLVGAGIVLRRKPQSHKRLMLLATVAILGAAVNRLPLPAPLAGRAMRFLLVDSFCLSLMAWDLITRRRIHVATLAGSCAILLDQIAQARVGDSEAWARGIAWWLQG